MDNEQSMYEEIEAAIRSKDQNIIFKLIRKYNLTMDGESLTYEQSIAVLEYLIDAQKKQRRVRFKVVE